MARLGRTKGLGGRGERCLGFVEVKPGQRNRSRQLVGVSSFLLERIGGAERFDMSVVQDDDTRHVVVPEGILPSMPYPSQSVKTQVVQIRPSAVVGVIGDLTRVVSGPL